MRKHSAILVVMLAAAALAAPVVRADYAVLRSGARLHITGYLQTGDRVTLMVAGGTVEVAASEVVAIEPEEVFVPNPPAEPALTGPFAQQIHDAASKNGVDEALIQRVIAAESNFNPRAVSRKYALGLMQLMPTTAADYSVQNIFDPKQNIDAGTRYLKSLIERYQGSVPLALAAYNAGPETVARYGGVPPYAETQNYVRRITTDLARAKRGTAAGSANPIQFGNINSAYIGSNPQKSTLKNGTAGGGGAGLTTAAAGAGGSMAAPAPDQHRP